jgi:hypothetical protein
MWLKLVGLLPTQTLCLPQRAVDDVVLLEYMRQNDPHKNTYGKDSLTDVHALEAKNLKCSNHKSMAPDFEYKVMTDNPNVIVC